MNQPQPDFKSSLYLGIAIPAHPLALNAQRKLDERRQRALSRYYIAAGAGGLAVGVHTTQFQIRDPKIGLFEPVLTLAKEELDRAEAARKPTRGGVKPKQPLVRIGGICGKTLQATNEAKLLRDLGYHAGLLSLAAFKNEDEDTLIAHCRFVADTIPIMGFYLQPAVGGRPLSYSFWRKFCEIPNVVAIKVAAFNRYQTLDVLRAIFDSGRNDINPYTGNDDSIIYDLCTSAYFPSPHGPRDIRFRGGLLGHWAVWTKKAVDQLFNCTRVKSRYAGMSGELMKLSHEVTDCNAAFFDVKNNFAGCIAGLHEVLRRQGLLEGIWCLDPQETLGPGQLDEINRVYAAYPHLNDDAFVAAGRDQWLSG